MFFKFITTFSLLFFVQSAYCQNISVPNGDIKAFIQAIQKANEFKTPVTIHLAKNGTYTFPTAFGKADYGNENQGMIALPAIAKERQISIQGNGATLKKQGTANFRLFFTEQKSNLTLNNLNIEGFKTDFQGGAIFMGYNAILTVRQSTFTNNQSTSNTEGGGGAVYCKSLSTMTFENCNFKGNSAKNNAGAINCLLSDLTLTNCKFIENKVIATTGNTQGGAIYIDGARGDKGKINITLCKFEKNEAGTIGGAIYAFPYNSNVMTIDQCEFYENKAKGIQNDKGLGGALGYGSGIYNKGTQDFSGSSNATQLIIKNSSFYNNTSIKHGGAMYLGKGTSKIENCTIAYNKAATSENKDGLGGGISFGEHEADLSNCTIAYNQAGHTGGALFGGKSIDLKACIIAHNTANNSGNKWNMHFNCGSNYQDKGNNLEFPDNIAKNTKNVTCVKNILLKDPLLGSLTYQNGGKVKTFQLKAGSPAITKSIGSK